MLNEHKRRAKPKAESIVLTSSISLILVTTWRNLDLRLTKLYKYHDSVLSSSSH